MDKDGKYGVEVTITFVVPFGASEEYVEAYEEGLAQQILSNITKEECEWGEKIGGYFVRDAQAVSRKVVERDQESEEDDEGSR